jgi:hypothetical protein
MIEPIPSTPMVRSQLLHHDTTLEYRINPALAQRSSTEVVRGY